MRFRGQFRRIGRLDGYVWQIQPLGSAVPVVPPGPSTTISASGPQRGRPEASVYWVRPVAQRDFRLRAVQPQFVVQMQQRPRPAGSAFTTTGAAISTQPPPLPGVATGFVGRKFLN